MNDKFLTTKEAAELLQKSSKQVAEYAKEGRLLGAEQQSGKGGKWAIPPDSVLIPTEPKTISLLSYIDALPGEDRRKLHETLSASYIRYLDYLINEGYISELEQLQVSKAKLSVVKPHKQKKTRDEVLTLITEWVKILAPVAPIVAAALAK